MGSGQTTRPHEIPTVERPRRAYGVAPSARVRLILASFLMLFVELGLIRWSTTNIIYLGYLTNFVLLSSFLGIGIGFLRAKSNRNLFPLAPVALAAFALLIVAFPVTVRSLSRGQLGGAFGLPALPRWILLPAVFLLAVWVMASVTEEVAHAFAGFQPLDAYRLDVLGSLLGIAAFAGLAFLQLPPLAWELVAAVVMVVLLGRRMRRWQWGGVTVLVLLLGVQSLLPGHHWSPYYKVQALRRAGGPQALDVRANNVPHQSAYAVDRLPSVAPFYLYPYRHLGTGGPREVLVIGAGTGNDVAVALAQQALHVDAVEIDPALRRLGETYHPDHPYQDPRVTVHVNDGRAFLERTGKRYDLIVLALTDSLTVVGGQSALRLENYLFTTEAMERTRERLKPDGTFAMYNFYEPWLLQRYAGTVRSAYGGDPCVETASVLGGRTQAVLTIGADGTARNCASVWRPPAVIPAPATDDHPFPTCAGAAFPASICWSSPCSWPQPW
jgi:Spermine/spermidine synthase domain